jgi:hypothetical protein
MGQEIEKKTRRCPRLGSPVPFSYCMECSDNHLPCWKVIDCWWELFDIKSYLKEHLSAENFQELVNQQPKEKVTSILELIEKAKNR